MDSIFLKLIRYNQATKEPSMSELLKTKRIASELEELISNAKKYICIFSFSLKIDSIYIERLKSASKRGVAMTLVFGVAPNDTEILDILSKMGCKVYYKKHMHAKFYYNEETLIVTSMNISEASEEKNYELGVLFKRHDHPEAFQKIKCEAKEIVENATLWTNNFSSKQTIKAVNGTKSKNSNREISGKCIRCGDSLRHDLDRPLCRSCYDVWSYWEEPSFPENYCHSCGKESDGISYAKPECNACYF